MVFPFRWLYALEVIGGTAQLKGPLRKWNFMQIEAVARVDSIFSRPIMRISSRFARSAARPMLNHCINAVAAPIGGACRLRGTCVGRSACVGRSTCAGRERCVPTLEAAAIGFCHCGRKVRVLTKCAVAPVPPWLRAEIYLRREGCVKAHKPILLGGNVCKPAH